MRVTFDSNTYRLVVDPSRYPKNPAYASAVKIHDALVAGQLTGLLSETVATLEGIQNAQRGQYFSSMKPKVDVEPEALPDGRIKLGIRVSPNDGLHPGLHAVVRQWLGDALKLGIRFMRAPRISVPRPADLLGDVYDLDSDASQQAHRQERFFELGRAIEARSVGFALVEALGNRINARLGATQPWFTGLNSPADAQEESEVKKAIAEWADGDTAAAHFGYENDVLCSEDLGNSAGAPSIFSPANRTWLESSHGVRFRTLSQLAAMV